MSCQIYLHYDFRTVICNQILWSLFTDADVDYRQSEGMMIYSFHQHLTEKFLKLNKQLYKLSEFIKYKLSKITSILSNLSNLINLYIPKCISMNFYAKTLKLAMAIWSNIFGLQRKSIA